MLKLCEFLIGCLRNVWPTFWFWVTEKKIRLCSSRNPLRVMLGAGVVSQKGWLATDIEHLNMLVIEDWHRYFSQNSIDSLLAEHVWEHLTEADGISAAINCHAFLKPGGYLRVAVPDGFHPSKQYRQAVEPMGIGIGSEDHKVLFTYLSLASIFEVAGFQVELLEYFDESGDFHQNDWHPDAGLVTRSMRYDERNRDGKPNYTSIVLDARKNGPV